MGIYAESFVAYAKPLLEPLENSSVENMNQALAIAQICWNISQVSDNEFKKALKNTQQTLCLDDNDFKQFMNDILLPMVIRYHEMFPSTD